jgi:Concanavalin A-like lectin/glucanases superfamily/Secretion system C-terminal sorting domain
LFDQVGEGIMKSTKMFISLFCLLLLALTASAQNQAVQLDGSSSYGLIPHDLVMNIGTGDFTVEAWVKGTSWPIPEPTIFSKGEGSYGSHFFLGIGNTGGIGDGQVRFGAQSWTNPSASVEAHSTYTLSLNEWHHLAAVRAGNTFKIYIDGVFNTQAVETIGSMSTNEPVYIGNNRTLTDFFDGCIDEVRFWDDARTDAEIAQHAFVQLTGNEPNLIGLWQMNDGAGSSFEDASVYGNNGVFIGNFNWVPANWAADASPWYGLDDHTEALWRNNEPAGTFIGHDESPNNYSLSLAEGAQFTGPNAHNGAIDFTGPWSVAINNDEIGNGWDAITIDAHFMATVIGDDNTHPLVTRYRWHNSGDPSFLFWVMPTGSLFGKVYLNEPGGTSVWAETAPGRIVPNESYDVQMTWSNNQTLKLYVNGELQGESTMTNEGVIRAGDDPLELGAVYYTGYPPEFFTGYIDEVRISDVDRSDLPPPNQFLTTDGFEQGIQSPPWTVLAANAVIEPDGHNGSSSCLALYNNEPVSAGLVTAPITPEQAFTVECWVQRRPGWNNRNYFAFSLTEGPAEGNELPLVGMSFRHGRFQEETLEVYWDNTLLAEVPLNFGNDWTLLQLDRDETGTWDVYWDNQLIISNVSDNHGVLQNPYLNVMGNGFYNEGGIRLDDICVGDPPPPPPNQYLGSDDFEDGNYTENPTWPYVQWTEAVYMATPGHNGSQWCVELHEWQQTGYGAIGIPMEIDDHYDIEFWVKPRPQSDHNYFRANISDGILNEGEDWFYVGVDGPQGHLLARWNGTYIGESTIDFPANSWSSVGMNRDSDGSWDVFWNGEFAFSVQDQFGELIEPWFTIRGQGWYDDGGVYVDDISVNHDAPPPADPVTLTLIPSNVIIPPSGGTLTYNVHIVSTLPDRYNDVYYWTNVVLPNGNAYPPGGWLMSQLVILPPYADIFRTGLTQNIPGFAQEGEYEFQAQFGFQQGVHVSDSFTFIKNDGLSSGNGVIDWDSGGDIGRDSGTAAEPLPSTFTVSAATPNPFNPTTTISVALPEAADLHMVVYNVTGQKVVELANGQFNAGIHRLTFDASNLASGLYFVRSTVPGELDQVQKVMLVR